MNDLHKLPKWAQDVIRDLLRERETAIDKLNDYLNNQSKSAFYVDDYVSTGEAERGPSSKRAYVQTYHMTVEHDGVVLEIHVTEDDGIRLSWSGSDGHRNEVALIPSSHQQVRLISKKNM